jgi:hypothetical protein
MFCLLSNLEVLRLKALPTYVKQKFTEKITEIALDHVAENEVPDYIMDIEEAKAEMERLGITPEEFESGGRRDRFDDEEEFEQVIVGEEFQGEYKPTYSEESFGDEDEEEDTADSDEDE